MGTTSSKHSSSGCRHRPCFCAAEFLGRKKRQLLLRPERKTKKKNNIGKEVINSSATLEDWLLSSPDSNPDFIRGGELWVRKHISKRVHPSSTREGHEDDVKSFPSMGKLVLIDREVADKESSFSFSSVSLVDVSSTSIVRTQSGKLKKKVRFRSPEEYDVFTFYSPKESLKMKSCDHEHGDDDYCSF